MTDTYGERVVPDTSYRPVKSYKNRLNLLNFAHKAGDRASCISRPALAKEIMCMGGNIS
jgi:hypothetical protein